MPSTPATLSAEIRDSSGKLVATPTIAGGAASRSFAWDGRMSDGSRAPDGAYSLKLIAKDASGADLVTTVHSVGTVRDVTQRDNELWLGLGGKVSLPLSDLLGVAVAA
ncbi:MULTISPECIES: flagellar hook assembly protein FlgD [Sphingomonas]|uniref:flagellar hook assembly protein FlgD n=1 Tax=Sphingomonas TaxID=13687 RepID=UPI0013B4736A|nr:MULTISPECIES: FlgD immunoglobulin-like domain containing protein [Sphingomonas]